MGFFRSFSSGDEKGIDFYQRGCLRLWCFQSSVLEVAKKYIIAKSSCLRQWRYGVFSEEVWSSQRKGETCRLTSKRLILHSGWEKQVDFSSLSSKAGRRFQMAKRNILYKFFFQMCQSCSSSFLIRHSQSSWWFLSCPTWRRYCRGLRRLHEFLS